MERLFGTLQDRLVTELRLNDVSSPEQAEVALTDFLPRFNRRFAVKAPQPGTAWRKLPRSMDPDTLFSFKFHRLVSADNCVRIGPDRIQIQPDSARRSYARTRVQVHIRMDGHIAIFHNSRCLATQQAPPEAPTLRLQPLQSRALPKTAAPKKASSKKKKTSPFKPPRRPRPPKKDHPWYLDYRDMYEPVYTPR